jgi:hypothetical protein
LTKQVKKCTRCGFSPCNCPSSVSTGRRPGRVEETEITETTEQGELKKNNQQNTGSSYFFTQSIESIAIDPGETLTLTLRDIPTNGNQVVKLDFTDRLEIETFSDSFTFGFNLTYRIIRINTIACFNLVQDYAKTSDSNQFYFLNPNLTWTDSPPEGIHTYELRVTLDINSGSFKSAIVHDRTLNAIVFPPQ